MLLGNFRTIIYPAITDSYAFSGVPIANGSKIYINPYVKMYQSIKK